MTSNTDEVVATPSPGDSIIVESGGGGWSDGVILAVQILLPLVVAGLIWGRKAIVSKIVTHFDRTCISALCPTISKRERLLKWTLTQLPYLEGGFSAIWRDGSQLCTLINTAVPGACPNPHRHWRKPPTHGQALAYKYLGVTPVFTDSDFEDRSFTFNVEKTMIEYVASLQQAVAKISRTDDGAMVSYSNDFVARGMGLVTGEQHRKTIIYIYPNSPDSKKLLFNVRGPYNSFGSAALRSPEMQHKSEKGFFKSLSKDFSKILLKSSNGREPISDVQIQVMHERDRARITFIPQHSGVYEVCLTTNGEHIVGSPYHINVEKNRSGLIDEINEKSSKKLCEENNNNIIEEETIINPSEPKTDRESTDLQEVIKTEEICTKSLINTKAEAKKRRDISGFESIPINTESNEFQINFKNRIKEFEDKSKLITKLEQSKSIDDCSNVIVEQENESVNKDLNDSEMEKSESFEESSESSFEVDNDSKLVVNGLMMSDSAKEEIVVAKVLKKRDDFSIAKNKLVKSSSNEDFASKRNPIIGNVRDKLRQRYAESRSVYSIDESRRKFVRRGSSLSDDLDNLKVPISTRTVVADECYLILRTSLTKLTNSEQNISKFDPDLLAGHSTASALLKNTDDEDRQAATKVPTVSSRNCNKGANLPNLLTDHQPCLDFREQFMRRREYWDRISSQNTSLASSMTSLNESPKISSHHSEMNLKAYEVRFDSSRYGGSVTDLNYYGTKERRRILLDDEDGKVHEIFEPIVDRIKLFDAASQADDLDFDLDGKGAASFRIGELKTVKKVKRIRYIPENGTIKAKLKERFEKAHRFFKKLERNASKIHTTDQ
ncbi:PREDICTED: uncharacterized protein LOC108558721 isoform X2 [Nicrophorus vespilloides]|uniref:Uncharacterized protein LOC108558721 isoform X2 n=1 Tax=Nicrophorus vespilloides TaxID=110193 RepID=A0ABM1M9F7_NICVS|nr:PREDICTED: uncharacterized protein LOC108558721 isoform X2 [Nicrophorus vespilloides]